MTWCPSVCPVDGYPVSGSGVLTVCLSSGAGSRYRSIAGLSAAAASVLHCDPRIDADLFYFLLLPLILFAVHSTGRIASCFGHLKGWTINISEPNRESAIVHNRSNALHSVFEEKPQFRHIILPGTGASFITLLLPGTTLSSTVQPYKARIA